MSIHYEIPLSRRQIEFLDLLMNGLDEWKSYRNKKQRDLGLAAFAHLLSHHPIDPAYVDGSGKPISPSLKNSTVHHIARSLYGIIGPSESRGNSNNRHPINGYFIDPSLHKDANDALRNGVFHGEVNEENLPILKTLYERDKELRQQFRMAWNPRFHPTEVGRLIDRSKEEARQGLERLTGILAMALVPYSFSFDATEKARGEAEEYKTRLESDGIITRVEEDDIGIRVIDTSIVEDPTGLGISGNQSSEYLYFERSVGKYRRKWFLPSVRRSQIERILEENSLVVPS